MVLIEVSVGTLGLDRTTDTPVVVLAEHDGERNLPICIGPSEASAIAMHLNDMKLSRPLTHDLLASVIRDFGGNLDEVVIDHMIDGKYIAELRMTRGSDRVATDARPSDAIAIALRLGARILVEEVLLDSATVELKEPPLDAGDAEPLGEEE